MLEKKVTVFQERVYAALMAVPRGRVTTYARLAKSVGCGSPRAVGQALRHNPFAPEVPCHRVIRHDLSTGGFFGKISGAAIQEKLLLLASEGVVFKNGKLADKSRLHDFTA